MEDNVLNLVSIKKSKAIKESIRDLDDVARILKSSIRDLTTYEKYASVKRRIEDLFVLYQDIKRAKQSKLDILERLKHE